MSAGTSPYVAPPRLTLPPEPTKQWVRPDPDTGERWSYAGRREGSLIGRWRQERPARDAEPTDRHVKLSWAALLGRLGGTVVPVDPPPPGPELGTAYVLPVEPPEDTWVRAEPDDGRRWRLRGGWWELQYARFHSPRSNDVVPVKWTSLLAVAPHLVVVDETPPVRRSWLGIDPALSGFGAVTVEDAAEKVAIRPPASASCGACDEHRAARVAAVRDLTVLVELVRKAGWEWVPRSQPGTGGLLRRILNPDRVIVL